MGDWLRRLLYPLVLPIIVGSIWVCGWVRQQDDRANRNRWSLPPVAHQLEPTPANAKPKLTPGVAQPFRTEFFAAADDDDVAEER